MELFSKMPRPALYSERDPLRLLPNAGNSAKGELAPSERDNRRDDQDDADHQEDHLRVPEESQADG